MACDLPITVPAASGSFAFISTRWSGDPGIVPYPFRGAPLRQPVGWRSSTIYTAVAPGAEVFIPTPLGTGVRDFFFAHYTTKTATGGVPCRTNILGSMSLLLEPNLDSPKLSNTDVQNGATYVPVANPTCVDVSLQPFKVAVYFSATPRDLNRNAYNCISGSYELFQLDLNALGGMLPPVDADKTSYVPNGPKIGTITIGEPT